MGRWKEKKKKGLRVGECGERKESVSFNIERGKHPIRRRRKVEDGRKEIRKEERIRRGGKV